MNPAKTFLSALRYGRLFGFLLILAIAGGMWAVDAVESALWFEKVDAVAEQVDLECITRSEQIEAATPCEDARKRATSEDKRLTQVFRIHTRYASPADGQQHTGDILMSMNELKRHDLKHWRVLAHKEKPGEIKPE